eukprot:401079-Amphidinium_carterae.2
MRWLQASRQRTTLLPPTFPVVLPFNMSGADVSLWIFRLLKGQQHTQLRSRELASSKLHIP